MLNEIQKDAAQRMDKTIKAFEHELSKIRTGRANPGLLDHVQVEYYGSLVPLSQAANIAVSDVRSLQIQVWERAMVPVIEKAIINSDLGLNPTTAGQVLHINLPPLTEERRKDLVKVVRGEGEQAKVAIRNVRRDANSSLKQLLNDKEISEDDERRAGGEIQKLTDKFIEQVDAILSEKEKELLEI